MVSDMEQATLGKTSWAGYAACAWAIAFALLSFYWAAGGTTGLDTLGGEIEERTRARDIWFIVIGGWAVGVVKVIGGLLALAQARSWGRGLSRRLVLLLAWLGGVGMMLYGGLGIMLDGLRVAGVLGMSDGADPSDARWHLVLWDPWWLLGGVLFAIAAWHTQRGPGTGHVIRDA
jgi:hypothetical protein